MLTKQEANLASQKIVLILKEEFISRVWNKEDILDVLKSMTLKLNKYGMPIEIAAISVKAILIDVSRDLNIVHPYSENHINEMLKDLETYI